MKKLFYVILCAFLTAAVLLGCKQPSGNTGTSSTDKPVPDEKLTLVSMTIHGVEVKNGKVGISEEAIKPENIKAKFSYGKVQEETIRVTVKSSPFSVDKTKPKKLELSVPAVKGKYLSWSGSVEVSYAEIKDFEVKVSSPDVYHGSSVIITVKSNPADSLEGFEASTENKDLEITPVTGKHNEFTVSVKNKAAAEKNGVVITVKSKTNPSIQAKTVTVNIKTIVPASLEIQCSDFNGKMYKDEELTLSIITDNSNPILDKSVEWSIKSPLYKHWFIITEEGKLKLKDDYAKEVVPNGASVTVIATSKLKDSVKAEKEITVYDNIAVVENVTCNMEEYTLGDSSKPRVTIGFKGLREVTHRNFIITEGLSGQGEPSSEYLEKVLFEDVGLASGVQISPKSHTNGDPALFYVYPVDPKTGKAKEDAAKIFFLTVWQKAEGIKIIKGNGDECNKAGNGNYILSMSQNLESENWEIKISPEYAKPHEFEYIITGDTNIEGNCYTGIGDWESNDSSTTFTIFTRGIGGFYGNKSNQITFTSKKNNNIKRTLYVTVLK